MSLFVIFAAGHAPDAPAWNKALEEARTPAVLAQDIDPSRHTGFWPVTVDGKRTGFYFLLESFPEIAAQYPAIAALEVEKPKVYSLGYGGDPDECAAAFYSALVLVKKFGGVAFDPQSGVVLRANELLTSARECQQMAAAGPQALR